MSGAQNGSRELDWRGLLQRLQYCYGCGRFGLPRQGKLPAGWTTLYQPHPDAPPGLHVCSAACAGEVRAAMAKGPVLAPLRVQSTIPMSAEMRQAMMDEAMQHAIDKGRMDGELLDALKKP